MFQDYALFPHLNVGENVAFGLRMQRLPDEEVRRRVAETLALVNMSAFTNRRVTDLSGGEQQRVALARALVPHPRLLMLDEPLGALDRALRAQLSEDLRAVLQKMDIPVIYVTHDQEEAFAFGDRLLVLHEGRIIQSGSPSQVYNHPDSLWLATFFGHKNRLQGRVEALEPLRVRTDDGLIDCGPQPRDFTIGQQVTLVLPSDAASLSEEAEGALKARVTDSRFQGMGHLVDFQLADGTELTFFFKDALKPGSSVFLALDAQSMLCLFLTRDSLSMNSHITIVKNNHLGEEVWRYPGQLIAQSARGFLFEAHFNRSDLDFHGMLLKHNDRFLELYLLREIFQYLPDLRPRRRIFERLVLQCDQTGAC